MSRRQFVRNGIGAFALPLLGGCLGASTGVSDPNGSESAARLSARPGAPTESPTLGLSELGLGGTRDGIMYVPADYSDDYAYPLFIGLHGAGGDADNWNGSYPDRAEARGMIFVAPDSRNSSWDLMTYPDRTFGADVAFIDDVLNHIFTHCRIDPNHIALGGFSDGASYSISLGIGNGDLFTHLVAFSPGFYVIPDPVVGTPEVFVSHGPHDSVLSFYNTAHTIVPALEDAGYNVTFHEFEGGHEVPADVSTAALDWFLD
jgi:phospholipase/carboxylesterase